MKLEVRKVLDNFRAFLNVSYPQIMEFAPRIFTETGYPIEDIVNDYYQANWELLVERALLTQPSTFLEIYGPGSDYECASHGRVHFQKAQATHRLLVSSIEEKSLDRLSGERVLLAREPFEEFVAVRDSWYYREPPFDCVYLEIGKEQRVFLEKEVRFELCGVGAS